MNLTNDQANAIIKEGRDYLCEFEGITPNIIDDHLNDYKERHSQMTNISNVYKAILNSARNRRHLPNVINNKIFDDLETILCKFTPDLIIQDYKNDFNLVFKNIAPKGTKYVSTNAWVQFSKSIISGANFISQFNNIQQFKTFTNAFTQNPISRIGLPLLLSEEIFGFGFALACDFIKENISPEYVKPDTHITDIFIKTEMSRPTASNYEIFKDVIEFSRIAKQVPYNVDKLFWLTGSGKFDLINKTVKTNRKYFIERIKKIL